MTVRHEIKSQLAKLLATEDLVVENRAVETASFNVETRVLTLPQWERASGTVYDMLVGHEVGHALFTPNQDPPKNIPHQFVNVVEDARIEKLMKRKYMGLAKTFYNGYKELSDNDFFVLEGEDLAKMNLADRANLWFKIGNYVDIPVKNDEEKEIIEMISKTETFADVIVVSEILYNYCKKAQEKVGDTDTQVQQQQESEQEQQQQVPQNNGKEGDVDDSSNQKTGETSAGKPDVQNGSTDPSPKEPEVHTVNSLDEKLKDLIGNNQQEYTYVEVPKVNLDTIIAPNDEIHYCIDDYFAEFAKRKECSDVYSGADKKYQEFKKSAQKEVNYLVKEFECRKAADSYARATTARTGVLDCTKLHTYKYNEDLFKKVSVIPDGKNHGLVFVLDWSGSMANILDDTCKQLFNLIWFCRKVSIPFEVYAFTNEWKRSYFDYQKDEYVNVKLKPHYEKKDGLLSVDDSFTMMNILTSKVSGKEIEKQMINIWRIAQYFSSHYCEYCIPDRLSLSGTPLNEALVSMHQILPKFQRENKLQKVQCIVLTDGEANPLTRHVEVERNNGNDVYIGQRRLSPQTTFVRDRKLGTTYRVEGQWNKFTDLVLCNLKDNFPSVNFIGIRVIASRDANNFIRNYTRNSIEEYCKLQANWKKERSFVIRSSGYDAYIGISASALANDSEFDVDDGATKAKIKSAFVKSLKTKKLNKKVLGEFISLVA